MPEKRHNTRRRKRIKVKFGPDESRKIGFTDDLSENGFFIHTVQLEPPLSTLGVELDAPGEEAIVVEAQVRWTKRIPVQMIQRGKKGGMGVRITQFVSGQEVFDRLVKGAGCKGT